MLRYAIAILVELALCTPGYADVPAPSGMELRAFAAGIRDAAHSRQLALSRMDVSVEVRGALIETTIEATFANPTNETLEGDFRFPLPHGAVVTGYALDVRGRMVDGVLLDRPRARAVYAARVRVGIDPGVAEVAPDNMFTTDVHPIWPGRGRTIRLRFAMPIPLDGVVKATRFGALRASFAPLDLQSEGQAREGPETSRTGSRALTARLHYHAA